MKKFLLLASLVALSACGGTAPAEPEATPPPPAEEEKMMEKEPEVMMEKEPEAMMEEEESGESVRMAAPGSTVGFVGANSLTSHAGTFNDVEAKVTFMNGAPTAVEATIAIGSMQTDSDGLTRHLLSEDFFEAETYPEATFVSTSIEGSGGSYAITGDLTMKGKTKSVTLNATVSEDSFSAEYGLDRIVFGVGDEGAGPKKIDELIPLTISLTLN